MTYETVVHDLVRRFPDWREEIFGSDNEFGYMDENDPLAYIAFGCVLLPRLEKAIESGNIVLVRAIFDFVEDVAVCSRLDAGLNNLLGVEIGEWLPDAANEKVFGPYLGSETKKVCGYVAGRRI